MFECILSGHALYMSQCICCWPFVCASEFIFSCRFPTCLNVFCFCNILFAVCPNAFSFCIPVCWNAFFWFRAGSPPPPPAAQKLPCVRMHFSFVFPYTRGGTLAKNISFQTHPDEDRAKAPKAVPGQGRQGEEGRADQAHLGPGS